MSCRQIAKDQPRIIVGRHGDGGEDFCRDDCPGCQPCTERHCRNCYRTHVTGWTCPSCVSGARESLASIVEMSARVEVEATLRGVDSEAANLAGPVADPERWGHVQASIKAGRLPADWQEVADHELHPLQVLGTLDMIVCDALDHDRSGRITVASSAAYLGANLSDLAQDEWFDFPDMVARLRACKAHIERVLHDGEQIDTGAPCMECEIPLVREWGLLAAADGWRCPKCREFRSEADYRLNVANTHRDTAEWLTAEQCSVKTKVAVGTIRVWGTRGLVDRRVDSGRTVYAIAQVEARHEKSIAKSSH
jgi:hypothetical protein